MIVADASWIIALRDPAGRHHRSAVVLEESVGAEIVLLPQLTLAECLVAPAKLGVSESSDAALRAAFEIVPADDGAPARWAVLRAATGLRLPDVVVLDAAIRHGARALVTFDEQLAAAAPRHGVDVLPDRERRTNP